MSPDNFGFGVWSNREDLDPILLQLPAPEVRYIEVQGVKYPVVKSQPLPRRQDWDDDAYLVADYSVTLNNLGHGESPWTANHLC